MKGWLKPYLPVALTQALRILADHVDGVDEEAFCLPDGRWRPRDLTRFIEAGSLADAEKEQRLRELAGGYVDLLLATKTKAALAELKHVADALSVVKPWLKRHDNST